MRKALLALVLLLSCSGAWAQPVHVYVTSCPFTVPSNFNATNTVEVIGAGGGGDFFGGFGGGGGAYSQVSNVALTPGASIGCQIGAGGSTTQPATNTYLCNSTSNCSSITDGAVIVGAKGGQGGGYGGQGGEASSSIGTVKHSGGAGTGGGGGGAAGPNGDGATSTSNTGGDGDAGNGGAGSSSSSPGGNGTEWDSTHGSGGGGHGEYSGTAGGTFGAGGGVSTGLAHSSGSDGLIVLTYVPVSHMVPRHHGTIF